MDRASIGKTHGLSLVNLSPQRALGNSHLARQLRIESAKARFLGDVVSDRQPVTVLDGEGNYRVSIPLERCLRRDLEHLDLEGLLLASECDRAPQHFFGARWAVKIHQLGSALECERAKQSGHAQHVVR